VILLGLAVVGGGVYLAQKALEIVKIQAEKACKHKWKTINKGKISRGERQIGDHYILECELCGDVQDKKMTI